MPVKVKNALKHDGHERKTMHLITALFAILVAAMIGPAAAFEEGVACETREHGGISALVCTVDVAKVDLRLFHTRTDGKPYGGFGPLVRELTDDGKRLVFAMNGGMYHEDLSPVGLYIEGGKTLKSANTNAGPGNFHMLPNGVFWIDGDKAGVSETRAFLKSGRKPAYATQSGPMLVIGGKLHHRFLVDSTSRKTRNGVGIRDGGKTAVFALSNGRVTFHEFATLFRDELGCNDALYLDGTISSVYAPLANHYDVLFPMGPIIAVVD